MSKILFSSFKCFKCVPTFLESGIMDRYYNEFCKKQFLPLFHYMLPIFVGHGGRFERSLWEDYVFVNRFFAQKVIEVLNPDDDYVCIHDYYLMVMLTFLRRWFN